MRSINIIAGLFVTLTLGSGLAMAEDNRVVAEVYAYPFKPITMKVAHYRFLANGEGQLAIVSPDGNVESTETLIRLSADRTQALLKAVDRLKNVTLVRNPKKDSEICRPGGIEFSIINSKNETQLIAREEICEWSEENQQYDALLIQLLLQSLQAASHL